MLRFSNILSNFNFNKQRYNRYVIKFQDFFFGLNPGKLSHLFVSEEKLAIVNF